MPSNQIGIEPKHVQFQSRPGRVTQMRGPHWESLLPTLIFGISLLYLCLFRHYSAMDPDEGIVLQGAERILRGEVPYRDFFSFYTPGSFYLVASLFQVFGDSFVVARSSIALVGAGCCVITYLLARRVCSRNIALLAAALSMTNSVAYRFMVLHNWYSTFFAFLAIYATVRLWESGSKGWALATGFLAALTTLIEQSKGAGLCLGFIIAYLILLNFKKQKLVGGARLAFLTLGFAVPLIVTFLYFGLTHGIAAMLQDWFWPLRHYAGANRVPYGYQNWSNEAREQMLFAGPAWIRMIEIVAISPAFIIPVLPLLGTAWLIYCTLQLKRRRSDHSKNEYYVLIGAAVLGMLLSVLIVRPDITHLMDLSPLWYLVLAWILGASEVQSPLLKKIRPWLLAFVCIAFGLMSLVLLLNLTGARYHVYTRRGEIRTRVQDTVIPYIQAHAQSGDEFLVYPYLPLYNYLTDTRSPARLDFFQSGMNTPAQADEIIRSLDSRRVRAILFNPGFAETFAVSWPNTPLTDVAKDPPASSIARNYRVCQLLTTGSGWHFQFMVRKDEMCP
jgi:4-amino-4-deoxy-L-arabinose transferase-like glycosyltransferase